jgi:2-methylcitrate dehydratase PrpD
MSVTAELSQFAAALTLERLPSELVERARYLVLDLAGNIIRGRTLESSAPLLAAVATLGWSPGRCHVLGDAGSYTPTGAALVNGCLAHSLDFDDTHAEGSLHPGAAVIPAALAAAEMEGHSGATALEGIVAGYEIACRLALALPASAHYERGFHPSATCGAFGAAVAAGRVFGLDAAGISSALGIALSQSAGTLQFLENGAWTKRFQVGWAAAAGLSAAVLARAGFKGAERAIEGRHGFLNAYSLAPNAERAVVGLGQRYELMATAVKPYPSCRYGHAGIDAALALRREHGIDAAQIDSVIYGLSRAGLQLIGEPAEQKAAPQNVVDAQFSAPFVLAVALTTGRMDWDSYALLGNPAVRALTGKIRCEHDAEIEAEFPANMSGRVTIRAGTGHFARKVVIPRGEPGNFPGSGELCAKFHSLAVPVVGKERSERLAAAVLQMDRLRDLSSLFQAEGTPS